MKSKLENLRPAAPSPAPLAPTPRPRNRRRGATRAQPPAVNGNGQHHAGNGAESAQAIVATVLPPAVVPPVAVPIAPPLPVVVTEVAPTIAPPVSPDEFRAALRHFPSGVTIVTLRSGDDVHGLTVSAFASVSPVPPIVVVAIDRRHYAHELLHHDGAVFGVNILHQEQRDLSDRFAWVKDEDRFAVGNWTKAVTGAPILADAAAWLDCTIYARLPAGTHTLFLGEVRATGVPVPDRPPLIYWSRGYRGLDLAGS